MYTYKKRGGCRSNNNRNIVGVGSKTVLGLHLKSVSRVRCFHKKTREPMTHSVSWFYDRKVRLLSDYLSVMFVHCT